jgi:hypothetical protein
VSGWFPDEATMQELARAFQIQRSALVFMRGLWTLQSTVRILASARTASNAAVQVDPPLRMLRRVADGG